MKKQLEKALKSVLTISLCLMMVVGSVPLSSFVGLKLPDFSGFFKTKAEAAQYSGECGTNLTWSFDKITGELVISGTGDMYNSWEGVYSPPWFDLYGDIKHINIESGVTSIGKNAFHGSEIKSINIPDTVTKINICAFNYLPDLTKFVVDENNSYYSVDKYGVLYNKSKTELLYYPIGNPSNSYSIPNGVSVIGVGAFGYCTNIFDIVFPDTLQKIEHSVFQGCSNLQNIFLPNGLTDIGRYAFSECRSITELIIPDSVVNIGDGAFEYCENINNISLSSNVSYIGENVFLYCYKLSDIYVDPQNICYSTDEIGVLYNKGKKELIAYPAGNPNINFVVPKTVTKIYDNAFRDCKNLNTIIVSDSVTNIGYAAFSGCENLTNIYMSKNVTYWGDLIFSFCSSLSTIIIPKGIIDVDTDMFRYCESLTKIEVDTLNPVYSSDKNGVLFNKNKTELLKYPKGNKSSYYIVPKSVSKICDGAFIECENLLTVLVGDSVSSIDYFAFYECKNLTGILMPANITKIGKSAFDFCDSLSAIYYTSSKEKWKTIDIEEYGNEDLLNATITYDYIPGDCAFSFGIYSSSPSLATTVGDDFVVTLSLYDFNNQFVENWGAPSVVVGNPDIVKVGIPQRIDGTNNPTNHLLYTLKIEGLKEGSSDIIITDMETGAVARMTVTIQNDLCFSYTFDNLPDREAGIIGDTHTQTNIYNLNGIYVNKFKYEPVENGYIVTFNVYNCSYMHGSVDVFDKKTNEWLSSVKIEKYEEFSNITEMFEILFYPLSSNAEKFFSYEASINSECTEVSLEVPKDSYITISNNVMKSPGSALYNFVDLYLIVVEAVCEIASFKQSFDDVSNKLTEELVYKIFDDESLKDIFVSKYADLSNDLFEIKVEEELKFEAITDYIFASEEFFEDSLEIDLRGIISSLDEVGSEIVLERFAPAQVQLALKAIFLTTSITSKLAQIIELISCGDNQYVAIHTTDYSNSQTIQGINVNDKNSAFSSNAVLQVFRVASNKNIVYNQDGTVTNYDDYVLYNIGFFEKGEKVQPNGYVEVKIPIPQDYNPNKAIVLHKTSNGWEKMLATIKDGYLVFETDNFSLYAVINTASTHVHSESETVFENQIKAECNQTGSYDSVIYCSVCGDEISRETITIDALIHQYNKAITQPSCTEVGYTTYTCSLCGDTYIGDEIDALEHDIVIDEAVAATCTETGLTEGQHCSRCNEKIVAQEIVSVKAHGYIVKYDSAKHWKECQCGLTIEEQNHSFANGNTCACGFARMISVTIRIKNNGGSNTIKYGETLRLTAITNDMPADAKIYWYVNGEKKGERETIDVTLSKGSIEVTVKLVDADGNILKNTNGEEISDSETVSVNSSFWQKIVSFFKNLFGMNRTVVQAIFKGVF